MVRLARNPAHGPDVGKGVRQTMTNRRGLRGPVLRAVVAALAFSALGFSVLGFATPATALNSSSPVISSLPSNATLVSQTEKVRLDVADFRVAQNALLGSYVSKFGSRFSPTESAALAQAQSDADRSLLNLQRAAVKTDRLAVAGASTTRVHRAATEAQRSYLRAVAAAENTSTSLEPVLRNRLSLGEAFSAYRDYSGALSNFADIGAQLDVIADRTKPRR